MCCAKVRRAAWLRSPMKFERWNSNWRIIDGSANLMEIATKTELFFGTERTFLATKSTLPVGR